MMRKALILMTALAGIGGLLAAAQASQDRVPDKDSSQVQTESFRKDGEHLGAPLDERPHEARERSREECREAHEERD